MRNEVPAPAGESSDPSSVKCTAIAEHGLNNSQDCQRFMVALISDIVTKRIDTGRANAANSVMNNVIKVAALEHRYGVDASGTPKAIDVVVSPDTKRITADPAKKSARERALAKLSEEERLALTS